jgi:putative chitinase
VLSFVLISVVAYVTWNHAADTKESGVGARGALREQTQALRESNCLNATAARDDQKRVVLQAGHPVTLAQLRALCPATPTSRLALFVEPLAAMAAEFQIEGRVRQAPFLAQVAHESAGFHYLREIASGEAYEGNEHLGNTFPGDGPRYRGRGLIQVTGRRNYGLCGLGLGLDLLSHPELLESIDNACRSAGWFWTVGAGLNLSKRAIAHGIPQGCDLNDLADAGDFTGITLAINGGTNGLDDRLAYLRRAEVGFA